jgi:hypothetical protein
VFLPDFLGGSRRSAQKFTVEIRQVVVVVLVEFDQIPRGEVFATPGASALSTPEKLRRGPVSPLQNPTSQSVLTRRPPPPVVRTLAPERRAKVQITYKFAPPVQAASGVTDNKTFEILSGETPIPEALGRL